MGYATFCAQTHSALFFFSSRRRHTRSLRDWSSDVCSSDLAELLTRWEVVLLRDVRGDLLRACRPARARLPVRPRRLGGAELAAGRAEHDPRGSRADDDGEEDVQEAKAVAEIRRRTARHRTARRDWFG